MFGIRYCGLLYPNHTNIVFKHIKNESIQLFIVTSFKRVDVSLQLMVLTLRPAGPVTLSVNIIIVKHLKLCDPVDLEAGITHYYVGNGTLMSIHFLLNNAMWSHRLQVLHRYHSFNAHLMYESILLMRYYFYLYLTYVLSWFLWFDSSIRFNLFII